MVVVLSACTSSDSGYVIPPSSPPESVDRISCDTTIAEFCAGSDCNRTLDQAEHDRRLCGSGLPPRLSACGDYEVVFKGYIDTGVNLYYRDGELVAIVGTGMLGRCTAGPQTFDAVHCSGETAPLAACPAR